MFNARHLFTVSALASLVAAVGIAAGCGGSNGDADGGLVNGGTNGDMFGNPSSSGGDAAVNLPRCIVATNQCVASCSGGTSTTVSGTVYDPAGKNPLYGITVYVPSVPPGDLPPGAGCYTCASLYQSGMPIAYAVTDYAKQAGERDSSWKAVGSAFAHKDGKGFDVKLEATPVSGRLVLRVNEPRPKPAD